MGCIPGTDLIQNGLQEIGSIFECRGDLVDDLVHLRRKTARRQPNVSTHATSGLVVT